MAKKKSGTTEELIEKYACYLDGKIQLPPAAVREMEETLGKSDFKGIGGKKLLKIFNKCAEIPNPFDSSEERAESDREAEKAAPEHPPVFSAGNSDKKIEVT